MPNIKSAKKRVRQNLKRYQHNISMRSMLRTYIKKTVEAINSGSKQAAIEAFKVATAVIDKMATKGLIHKNKAARHKSRLAAKIKDLK